MAAASWEEVPDGWPAPSEDLLQRITERALVPLCSDGARPGQDRLRSYYATDTDDTGAWFSELLPTDPNDITATDLLAVSLLSVRLQPLAERRLLNDGGHRNAALKALAEFA